MAQTHPQHPNTYRITHEWQSMTRIECDFEVKMPINLLNGANNNGSALKNHTNCSTNGNQYVVQLNYSNSDLIFTQSILWFSRYFFMGFLLFSVNNILESEMSLIKISIVVGGKYKCRFVWTWFKHVLFEIFL